MTEDKLNEQNPYAVEMSISELLEKIDEIANGPEVSEQKYRYDTRILADGLMTDTPEMAGSIMEDTLNTDEMDDMEEMDMRSYYVSTTYVEKEGLTTSPLYYHRDETPEILRDVPMEDYLQDAAMVYCAREVSVELRRRKGEGDRYHETDLSLGELVDKLFEDYPELNEVYIEFRPSLDNRSHILITVHTQKAPEDRHILNRYSTDRVIIEEDAYPFAVCETSDADELPEEDEAYVIEEKVDNVEDGISSWVVSKSL